MAKRYGTTYQIPKWKYSDLFVNKFNEVDELPVPDMLVKEPHYRYAQEHFDKYAEDFRTKTVDVLGYFQNVKYFNYSEVKEFLQFKPELVAGIREKYKHLFTKPTIAVGVRRTDYTVTGNYYQLEPRYYVLALQKFGDLNDYNIIFITDDISYSWFHFKCLPNAFFPKFDSDIEQFICGTLVSDGWIIANSTFHWFSALLSDCGKAIQPKELFAGPLLEKEGPNHFYIENEKFEIFDHNK